MTIRKTLTKKANNEDFLIKELTVEEIIAFFDQAQNPINESGEPGSQEDDMVTGLMAQLNEVLLISIPGLNAEQLTTWAPSEIEKLYEGFREVNQTFFTIAQGLGLNNLMEEVKQAIAKDFSSLFVASLKADT
jgi:hypothetical protein